MAANRAVLSLQLEQILHSLKEQGERKESLKSFNDEILDDNQFRFLYSLKEFNGPFYVAEIIPMFCQNVQTNIGELTQILGRERVNYPALVQSCFRLKGCSLSMGARRLVVASVSLLEEAENKNKAGCGLVLNRINHEFQTLQSSLEMIVELERRIVSHEV